MSHECHWHGGLFIGFLTGVIWLVLALNGTLAGFFGLIGLGQLGHILILIIAIIGFLAFLVFGFFIFRKVWRHCK